MNVVVYLEHRFDRTPDGAVWTQTTFPYAFWRGYLDVFDGVRVVARVRDVAGAPHGAKRADGAGVAFAAVPDYRGPAQYLRVARSVGRVARGAIGPGDAVILRVCSPLGARVEPDLRRGRRPYGVQVVADPHDVFAPGSIDHPLRRAFRWHFPRQLRRQCAGAAASAYVTEFALQRRYPPAPGAYSTHYSDVRLPESAFAPAPRPERAGPGPATVITVGTLAQLYKAPDVLIDAVAACVRGGADLRLVLVGDGKHRAGLEARAAAAGLGDRARFLGQLPAGPEVIAQYDRADLFALPSHQEGLPRAMIEAMARGLPCVGSTVGGIPELLEPEDLVPPGDAPALARKLGELVADPGRMARTSARNLDFARLYTEEMLRRRRLAFLEHLRAATETWRSRRQGSTIP